MRVGKRMQGVVEVDDVGRRGKGVKLMLRLGVGVGEGVLGVRCLMMRRGGGDGGGRWQLRWWKWMLHHAWQHQRVMTMMMMMTSVVITGTLLLLRVCVRVRVRGGGRTCGGRPRRRWVRAQGLRLGQGLGRGVSVCCGDLTDGRWRRWRLLRLA